MNNGSSRANAGTSVSVTNGSSADVPSVSPDLSSPSHLDLAVERVEHMMEEMTPISTNSPMAVDAGDEGEAAPATTAPPAMQAETVLPPSNSISVVEQQAHLRKAILQIHGDASLTAGERARRIQHLMTAQYAAAKNLNAANVRAANGMSSTMLVENDRQSATSRRPTSLHAIHEHEIAGMHMHVEGQACGQSHEPSAADLAPSYHDLNKMTLGCKHYKRGAKLQAACCGEWYVCRFCHDESAAGTTHKLDRHATETMMCMHCNAVQPVAGNCRECHKTLGTYWCEVCRLWDNDTDKKVYHCDDCGLCRIGEGLGIDYFHCDQCGICMSMSMKDNHRCIERSLECDCPICGEYMFTSTNTVVFMPCGHCIHHSCYQDHIKNSYQCPICWKSLADMTNYFREIDRMLEQHEMPPDYADYHSIVLCNDCERRSKTKYHFLYHKCQHCRSYNTTLVQTVVERDATAVGEGTARVEGNSEERDGGGNRLPPRRIDTTADGDVAATGLNSETLSPRSSARERSESSASRASASTSTSTSSVRVGLAASIMSSSTTSSSVMAPDDNESARDGRRPW